MVDITENFVKECLRKTQTFFLSQYVEKFSWKVVYGWIKRLQKREKILLTMGKKQHSMQWEETNKPCSLSMF